MRSSLIEVISQMQINGDAFIRAINCSDVKELCDLEDIPLYNVGTGKFNKLCQQGFLLEYSFKSALSAPLGFNNYQQYQRYEITSSLQTPVFWNVGKVLAS